MGLSLKPKMLVLAFATRAATCLTHLTVKEMQYILDDCPEGYACPNHYDGPNGPEHQDNITIPTFEVDSEEWVAEALDLFDQGNYRGATTILQDLLEYMPGNAAIMEHLNVRLVPTLVPTPAKKDVAIILLLLLLIFPVLCAHFASPFLDGVS